MRHTNLLFCLLAAACGSSVENNVQPSADSEAEVREPGELATDARRPELGDDLRVLRAAQISMADGIAQAEAEHGAVIEAKYELDDSGQLSLSIYPVGAGLDTDAERNVFQEL